MTHDHKASITLQGEGSMFEICKCGYFRSFYGCIAAKPAIWHANDEESEMLNLLVQQWTSEDDLNTQRGQAFLLGVGEGKKQAAEYLLKLAAESFIAGKDVPAKMLREVSELLTLEAKTNTATAKANLEK